MLGPKVTYGFDILASRNSDDRNGPRARIALLVIFCFVLVPIKQFQILQFLNLFAFMALVLAAGTVATSLVAWLLGFLIVLVGLNVLSGNVSFALLKPLWGAMAILALFSVHRKFGRMFYVRFTSISFGLMLIFFVLHAANQTGLNDLFRVTEQADIVHLNRVTAPFLFAGDFGLASLFLAILSFALGTKRFNIVGMGFLVFLLFSQSRLALAGTPFIILMTNTGRKQIWLFAIASAAVAIILLNIEKFFDLFPYVFRFFDRVDFYVSESKRASEIIYLYQNFWSLFVSGTDTFILADGLETAESSIVSYAVKSGVLVTVLFWGSFYFFATRDLSGGFRLVTLFFLLSILGAPMDRPKSSVFLIISAAGVLHCLGSNRRKILDCRLRQHQVAH